MSEVQISVVKAQDTQIVTAVPGIQGPVGPGFPSGGTTNQVLVKASADNYDTTWSEVTSAMIGDLEIVNADIATNAAIALSKLATGALPSGITVASSNIVDGTIVNADISASAAIALSKLATGALPSGITVASTNIVDGTIVNADINASAAIVDTKLATITTGGKVNNSATTATSANTASAIVARDGSGNFSANTITANLTGTASAIADNIVTSAKIVDGAIVNADINASAGIVDTKLATIATSNKVSASAINVSGATAIPEIQGADEFLIRDASDGSTPNKKVTVSGLTEYFRTEISPFYTDIMVNTTPFIWNQTNDKYYEYRNTLNVSQFTNPTNAGGGYTTQPDLRVQSSMRRVGLHPSGFVSYYLDGDDSNFLAGDWLKIYEGENKAGNGTTNNYIRDGVETWASGTVYNFRQRVTHDGSVWECIVPTVSGTAPSGGTVSSSGIIDTAASGNVMVEVPEFFVRIDWNDGLSWKNIAGADVDGEYKLLSPSGLAPLDPLRVYYVLPKAEYDTLGAGEKDKWIRHPAFWASGDTTDDCTVYIDGTSPTVFEPSPYVGQRDASGVTRVWDGSAFGYYTSSGTATTSGDFDEASAIRYRYIAGYQCSTDGTKLQSITASGVFTSHTRATGLTRARAIASGWANGDYGLWNACQLLTVMEYRNFFIQDPTVGIGRGRDNWNALGGYRDYPQGILNDKGNRTFNNTTDGRNSTAGSDDLAAMQWRGLEHYYAGTARWVHGININGITTSNEFGAINYVALNQDRFADSTATNYQQVGLSETFNVDNFGGGFFDQAGIFFIPVRGGTASTFVTDRYRGTNGTGWRVLAVGGISTRGSRCGPWDFISADGPGTSGAVVGSLLSR
jgi:hypothetical protein